MHLPYLEELGAVYLYCKGVKFLQSSFLFKVLCVVSETVFADGICRYTGISSTLLNLSKALHTADLVTCSGVHGRVLQKFNCYLLHRIQRISLGIDETGVWNSRTKHGSSTGIFSRTSFVFDIYCWPVMRSRFQLHPFVCRSHPVYGGSYRFFCSMAIRLVWRSWPTEAI